MIPIVIFAYNRPAHLQRLLDSLFDDELAKSSEIYIFCDGKKTSASESQSSAIEEVWRIAKNENRASSISVHTQPNNLGLAQNIRFGISHAFQKHDAVIVLEDDLIVARGFLDYMNAALSKYASDPQVMQISGFQFPFELTPSEPFFMKPTVTTGWGTWKRVWECVDFKAGGYNDLKTDVQLRKSFNFNGNYDFTNILLRQMERGGRDSWGAIFWWHVFKHSGLVLYPGYTLIQHRDDCGSGTHVSNYEHYNWPNWDKDYQVGRLPESISESTEKYKEFCEYISKSRKKRFKLSVLLRKIRRRLFGS